MNIKAYLPFANAGVQSQLAYKWNFLGFFIGEIFFSFVLYYLWKAVFLHTAPGTINGFDILDMTVYIFVTNITGYLVGTDVAYAVGEEIVDGSIAMRIIKPVSYDMSLLVTELGGKAVLFCMILVPVFTGVELFRWSQAGAVMFSLPRFLTYLCSAGLSYLILFYFDLCFGFLAFALKNLWGINLLKASIIRFLSGGMIPLAFFPLWALGVLKFLPFASMSYTPVMIYTGMYGANETLQAVALQVFWIAALYGLSKFIWKVTINQLTVQGG